ncbi:MAG: hypothetical protein J6A79_02705 [Clostridia bacterium]|nr:hypothetical protein [Clostridia bacterium]
MKTIHDGFVKNRDRTKKLEGTLAEALTAWCALSIAASEPFYTEEAADTPEANAALHAPLKRPDGSVADSNGDDYKALYEYGKAETVSRFGNYIPNEEPERSYRDYRQDMEAACKAGKPLQEMIDAGRKAVESSFMGDKDAFDQAVKNLDRDANIVFSGKHFVLTGFGEYEDGVIAEIEERGGVIHSHMVKMADYLIVCLESPGASKVKEALNWRKKGASNQIVSDYQMWQAMLGKASSSSVAQKKPTATPKTTSSSASRSSTVTQNKTASTSASKAPSSTSSRAKKTASDQMAGLEKTVSSTASELANAARTATTAEEKKAIQEAQSILENMQSEMSSTSSALEKHAEHLRKQEEEKEKRMAEARAKGKSSKDETDMLAVLLIEEDQGNLNRPDDDFASTFAEDFAAYTPQQLISLRAKVKPKMHDSSFVEAAKEDMLSRPVKDRFGISTANWFNLSNLWDFNDKGAKAIEKTRQYYRESEMYELRKLMSDHKQAGIDSVNSQLSGFNSAWDSFGGVRNDLHICIGTCDEPIPDSRKVFDVMIDGTNHAYIQLQHPSMGYLTIPIMNLFASVWKTTPEKVWEAALNNSINDSRSVSSVTSRADAMKAKNKALSAIGMTTSQVKKPSTPPSAQKSTPRSVPSNPSIYNTSTPSNNSKRIKEIEETIASLRREHDSIRGIFGFVKKNKIKKEINELEQELNILRRG